MLRLVQVKATPSCPTNSITGEFDALKLFFDRARLRRYQTTVLGRCTDD
jgi:hypothetical protein